MDSYILSGLLIVTGAVIGFLVAYIRLKVNSNSPISKELEELKISSSSDRKHNEILESQAQDLQAQIESLRQREITLSGDLERLKSENKSLLEKNQEQIKNLQEMKKGFQIEFENLANKIFEEKSEKFNSQNKRSLDQILTPLKERILEFQKKVEETNTDRIKETTTLRQELKNLKDMSELMSQRAENLTNALKNDSKAQGNWGEMILENILEASGLVKDREYFTQQSFQSEGRRLQPDVIIKLPDNKSVIIDSKVSLTAYERFVNEPDDVLKKEALKNHILSLTTHFKALADKKYQDLPEGSKLDFILMFVPVEPAYLTALNANQTLFNDAYDKGVVMVSPSTLIASLKIIASTWKHEYQNKNAQDIAQRGKLLYEKFIGFAEEFQKVGDQIKRADQSYEDAFKKLKSGRGSLTTQAKQLEELGIKSNKKLSNELLDDE